MTEPSILRLAFVKSTGISLNVSTIICSVTSTSSNCAGSISFSIGLFNWYFYKGEKNEYPFHIDDIQIVEQFFRTLQSKFLEVFHPILITTRSYKKKWLNQYLSLSKVFDIPVISTTSVGYIVGGPYEGKKMVGCSLATDKNKIILSKY